MVPVQEGTYKTRILFQHFSGYIPWHPVPPPPPWATPTSGKVLTSRFPFSSRHLATSVLISRSVSLEVGFPDCPLFLFYALLQEQVSSIPTSGLGPRTFWERKEGDKAGGHLAFLIPLFSVGLQNRQTFGQTVDFRGIFLKLNIIFLVTF